MSLARILAHVKRPVDSICLSTLSFDTPEEFQAEIARQHQHWTALLEQSPHERVHAAPTVRHAAPRHPAATKK